MSCVRCDEINLLGLARWVKGYLGCFWGGLGCFWLGGLATTYLLSALSASQVFFDPQKPRPPYPDRGRTWVFGHFREGGLLCFLYEFYRCGWEVPSTSFHKWSLPLPVFLIVGVLPKQKQGGLEIHPSLLESGRSTVARILVIWGVLPWGHSAKVGVLP